MSMYTRRFYTDAYPYFLQAHMHTLSYSHSYMNILCVTESCACYHVSLCAASSHPLLVLLF